MLRHLHLPTIDVQGTHYVHFHTFMSHSCTFCTFCTFQYSHTALSITLLTLYVLYSLASIISPVLNPRPSSEEPPHHRSPHSAVSVLLHLCEPMCSIPF